jgi:pimeloyl-ACP methyl ester carboxylesterase
LAMPVLAIGGSNAVGLNLARALAPSAPHVVGEVIAESGHYVPEERPDSTTAALLKALSGAGLGRQTTRLRPIR